MLKRVADVILASLGLLLMSPILLPTIVTIWLQDFHSPFYIANRVGKDGRLFRMVKLRSMVVKADRAGVYSTAGNDSRITKVGHFVRRYKLDEISQLWNVLKGDMSLVGPRPNVPNEVALYTVAEKQLLSVKPGITDIASIVFADEGEILRNSPDPDLDYNQIIRPWKSRLGLLYINNQSLLLDLKLIYLTATTIMSRAKALNAVQEILLQFHADEQVKKAAARSEKLLPFPPPGATEIVMSRQAPTTAYLSNANTTATA